MILRKSLAALSLGAPAAFIAHALLFRSEHEIGGAAHGVVLSLAYAMTASIVIAFAALAWRGKRAANGSVLAARMSTVLPGPAAIFTTATALFTLCESLETHHAGRAAWLALSVLLLTSWFVSILARAFVRSIAAAIVAVVQSRFRARVPLRRIQRNYRPRAPRFALTPRLFVRPPPAF